MGWFPLAPGEVYVPYYRGSRHYVERVNVTNTVVNVTRVTTIYNQRNATNITYVNQRVNNGVTLVSRDTFVNARPVARNLGRFDARQLENARVERRIDVQPIRASVVGSGAPARYRPPQAIINRQVVATQRPAPPRQPFDQRQRPVDIRTERPGEQPRQTGTPVVRNADTDRPLAHPQQPVSPPETAVRPQFPRPEARPQQPMAPVAPRPRRGKSERQSLLARLVTSAGQTGPAGAGTKPCPGPRRREQVPQLAAAAPAGGPCPEPRTAGATPGAASGPARPGPAAKIARLSSSAMMKCQSQTRDWHFLCVRQIAALTINY